MKFLLEELNKMFKICLKRFFREIMDTLKMNDYNEDPKAGGT